MDRLGYRIFFDRYALRDSEDRDFHEGDFVAVAEGKPLGQHETGRIREIGNLITVRLDSGREVSVPSSCIEKILEIDTDQMFTRVATGIAAQEKHMNRDIWARRFRWLLDDFRFVPDGRVLAGAGTGRNLTYFNYYVLPSPGDSRISIVQRLSDIAEVISHGGGVGLNISSIRPKSSYVKGVDAKTSGSVSWAGLYSFAAGLLEQGSTRRGTLLLILDDWHPDIEEFICCKRDISRLSNTNISVNISDDFMKAVKDDLEWTTVFPDTSHPSYNTEWNGNITDWRNKGYAVKEYSCIRARKLWEMIVDSIWNCSEPGIFFGGTYNRMSNTRYYCHIQGTNPYGEQGLPEWGSCNYGSLNLPAFLETDEEGNALRIDKKSLGKAVRYAVRFLDNVIDDTPYFFEENRKRQKNERRIGIGTTGLAELLARLHIPYGSEKCLKLIDDMYKFIATEAYTASCELALEKGPFDRFTASGFLSGGFASMLPKKLRDMIASQGIRNCTLLTQAPSGMTGTMIGTSPGIEPYHALEWKRGTGPDSETVSFPGYAEWKESGEKKLPPWMVTKENLTPEDHLKMLSTVQKWIDASVSKSFEIPASYTKDQVSSFIIRMYDSGCKNAMLIKKQEEPKTQEAPADESQQKKETDEILKLKNILQEKEQRIRMLQETNLSLAKLVNSNIAKEAGGDPFKTRSRSKVMKGITEKRDTPVGPAYITVNKDDNDEMFEVFATVGKVGSDVAADAEGICRLISLVLRMPSPYTADERAWAVIRQLRGIGSGNAMGSGRDRVMSLSDGIAMTMESVVKSKPPKEEEEAVGDICPECGNATLFNTEGCRKCMTCGYTK